MNIPLFRKGLDHVTAHPEEHDQNVWGQRTACGTTGCLAYWFVIFAGYEVEWIGDSACWTVDGEFIAAVAEREAGLSSWQAIRLFDDRNSLDRHGDLAAEFTDGEIQRAEMTGGDS